VKVLEGILPGLRRDDLVRQVRGPIKDLPSPPEGQSE
jgi:hypothetical protein